VPQRQWSRLAQLGYFLRTIDLTGIMPPRIRAQVCLCKAHGCANEDRTSSITGLVLKGRILSDMEFRAHQRDEKSVRRSARNPLLGPTEDGSGTAHPITHSESLPSPGSLAVSRPESAAPQCPPFSREPFRTPSGISCDTPPHQPSHASTEDLDHENPSSDHATSQSSVDQPSTQDHDKGNDGARKAAGHWQGDPSTNTIPRRISQAIESCRLDFQSWQRADIPCDELVFEETTGEEEPPPHIPLRVDIMSNTEFIEYEAVMFALLDRIDKIKTRGNEDCEVAKRNVLSSVEDEIDRLRGIKIHVWKSRAANGSQGSSIPRSGPFREIDTGTKYCESYQHH
jgi:hypothetical protein